MGDSEQATGEQRAPLHVHLDEDGPIRRLRWYERREWAHGNAREAGVNDTAGLLPTASSHRSLNLTIADATAVGSAGAVSYRHVGRLALIRLAQAHVEEVV